MSLQHAWATVNSANGLAAANFTQAGVAITNAAYLGDGRIDRKVTLTAHATGADIWIDMGSAQNLTFLAMLNSNLVSGGVVTATIRASSSATFAADVVTAKAASTVNAAAPDNKDHVFQFDAVSRRYWSVLLAWTIGSFAVTLGEIFAGNATVLTRAIVYGHGGTRRYMTSRFTGYSGETRAQFIAGPIRLRRFPFEALSAAERNELILMHHTARAGATPLLWCEQYEAGTAAAGAAYQDCIFGRLQEDEFEWGEEDTGLYSMSALSLLSLAREVGS